MEKSLKRSVFFDNVETIVFKNSLEENMNLVGTFYRNRKDLILFIFYIINGFFIIHFLYNFQIFYTFLFCLIMFFANVIFLIFELAISYQATIWKNKIQHNKKSEALATEKMLNNILTETSTDFSQNHQLITKVLPALKGLISFALFLEKPTLMVVHLIHSKYMKGSGKDNKTLSEDYINKHQDQKHLWFMFSDLIVTIVDDIMVEKLKIEQDEKDRLINSFITNNLLQSLNPSYYEDLLKDTDPKTLNDFESLQKQIEQGNFKNFAQYKETFSKKLGSKDQHKNINKFLIHCTQFEKTKIK